MNKGIANMRKEAPEDVDLDVMFAYTNDLKNVTFANKTASYLKKVVIMLDLDRCKMHRLFKKAKVLDEFDGLVKKLKNRNDIKKDLMDEKRKRPSKTRS